MAEQVPADRHPESEEFLDESPFLSSLRSVLVVDLAVLSLWTAWAHAGPGGISRLALVAVWSVPALWNLATRPMLRKLAWRRIRRHPRKAGFLILCVSVVTTLLTLTTAMSDSVSRSARTAVDRQLGAIDEMILASSPDVRVQAQSRLDLVLNERTDTVNDLSLIVRAQLGFVVADTVLRNDVRAAAPVERSVKILEMDVQAAADFGPDPQATGLADRKNPGPGKIYLGPHTAAVLGARVGDSVTMADPLSGDRVFVVEAVLPARGFAILPLDGGDTSNIAIVGTGTLTTQEIQPALRYVIAISNRDGSKSSTTVSERLERAFEAADASTTSDGQARPGINVSVDNVKAQVLQNAASRAEPVSRLLKTLALLFSIGSGLLLLTLFFGLAVTRTSEIGALRSVGLRRRDAVSAFGVEGWCYAATGSVVGALAGFGAASIALRSGPARSGIVAVTAGPGLRALWIGLACGFVLSGIAIAASMLLSTRGTIQSSFGSSGEITHTPVTSVAGAVGFGFLAVVGALLMLRSVDSRGSFGFLGGLLLFVTGAAPLLRRTKALRRLATPLHRYRIAIAAVALAAAIAFPLAMPGWFRHTGIGTTLSYATVLMVIGALLARSFAPRLQMPGRAGPTAGGRRAAQTVTNASPQVAPKRDLLLRGTTTALVMALTTVAFMRAGLADELSTRTTASQGGWEMIVSAADVSQLPAVVRAVSGMAEIAAISSVDVEVANTEGRTARTTATQVGSDYLTQTPARLSLRSPGFPDDVSVYGALATQVGSVIADRSLFVDGGTRLHDVRVGEKLYVRDLRSGRTQTLTVIGVARSLAGLGGLLMGPTTASDLRGGVFAADRLLLTAKNPDPAAPDKLQEALNGPAVSARKFTSDARSGFGEPFSVLRSLAWLLWTGGLLVVGALSVLMVRSASDRKRDWRVLRSLGMSSPEIRRIALSEVLQLLLPAAVVGWLVGVVVAWHLVWAGALGVDAARPFSFVSLLGTVCVAVVPVLAVDRYLRWSLAHDAPMRR